MKHAMQITIGLADRGRTFTMKRIHDLTLADGK